MAKRVRPVVAIGTTVDIGGVWEGEVIDITKTHVVIRGKDGRIIPVERVIVEKEVIKNA